jgi:hypothetical protein
MLEVIKQLGIVTPFIYAAGTYGFFHYLDKQASAKAKKAISGSLKPLEYDRAAVAVALIEIFDRLYTRPLLGWRAALRSALFTSIAYEWRVCQVSTPMKRPTAGAVGRRTIRNCFLSCRSGSLFDNDESGHRWMEFAVIGEAAGSFGNVLTGLFVFQGFGAPGTVVRCRGMRRQVIVLPLDRIAELDRYARGAECKALDLDDMGSWRVGT